MRYRIALLSSLAAVAVLSSGASAATPTEGLSRLYPSDVSGAPESIVHDAASAYAWLASLSGGRWASDTPAATPAASSGYGGERINGSTFQTIAAGSTVMEVYLPGSPHEMTIMYHMDGPNILLANHYCSARNVPQWKFVKSDKPGEITFVFDGGTNLNPGVDSYARAMTYHVVDRDHFVETATVAVGGKFTVRSSAQHRELPQQSASSQ